METVQTENKSFVRDIHSKALLNTDRIALENHRQRQSQLSQINNESQEIKPVSYTHLRDQETGSNGVCRGLL